MVCPRCGWIMRLLNIRQHNNYSDELYQCKCGATHLHIVPRKFGKLAADNYLSLRSVQASEK